MEPESSWIPVGFITPSHSGNFYTVSYGVDCRHDSDPALLWLWHGSAAVAPIQPLAWEPTYATSAALKRQKTKKKKKRERKSAKFNKIRFYYTFNTLAELMVMSHPNKEEKVVAQKSHLQLFVIEYILEVNLPILNLSII